MDLTDYKEAPESNPFPEAKPETVETIAKICEVVGSKVKPEDEDNDPIKSIGVLHNERALGALYEIAAGMHDARQMRGYTLQTGLYRGGSACVIACALRDHISDYLPMIAVDNFPRYGPWATTMDRAYLQVRDNMYDLGLQGDLAPVICDSYQFLFNFWNRPLRMAFIDSTHRYVLTRHETEILSRYIVKNGWMIFDDCFNESDEFYMPGVSHAIEEFLETTTRDYELWQASKLLIVRLC